LVVPGVAVGSLCPTYLLLLLLLLWTVRPYSL